MMTADCLAIAARESLSEESAMMSGQSLTLIAADVLVPLYFFLTLSLISPKKFILNALLRFKPQTFNCLYTYITRYLFNIFTARLH